MRTLWKPLLLATVCLATVAMCSSPSTLNVDLARRMGDRSREWGLIYFVSWQKDRDSRYLNMSREFMAASVKSYFDIQVRIGHSFPVFYDLDRRRLQGCAFLRRIDREASKFRVELENTSREGCLR